MSEIIVRKGNWTYKEKGFVEGEFYSDFISEKPEKGRFNNLKIVGIHKLFNAQSKIQSTSNDSNLIQKYRLLEDVEMFPLPGDDILLNKKKKVTLRDVRLSEIKILDSFQHDNFTKGRLKGKMFGTLIEKELIQKKDITPAQVLVEKEELIGQEEVEGSSYLENDSPVDFDKEIAQPVPTRPSSSCCRPSVFNSSGCLRSSSGCGSFGFAGSGCLGMLMRFIGIIFGILLLLSLLKDCGSFMSNKTENSEERVVVPAQDTVKVYQIDTVERLVKDTLRTTDTILQSDTITLIKTKLPLPKVLFKSNSAIIRYSSLKGLSKLGDSLMANQDIKIVITGHTDATGESKHNDTLSFCRAKAVKDFLIENNKIEKSRIRIEGYGESCPIEDNESLEGKTINRRVEFRYLHSPSNCASSPIIINENYCFQDGFMSGYENLNSNDSLVKEDSIKAKDETELVEREFFYSLLDVSSFENVRRKPNKLSRVLFRIYPDDKFILLEKNSNYCKIKFKSVVGYIFTIDIVKHESQ